MDIFRIFDSLNYLPNLQVAMEAVQDTHADLRGGDLLHRRHPRSEARTKYSLKYYVKLAKELEQMGAHFLAIKDMAGLCRPYAAHAAGQGAARRRSACRSTSTRTTRAASAPASVLEAATRAWTWWTCAIASMCGIDAASRT